MTHLFILLLASAQGPVASLALDKAVVNAALHHQLGVCALLCDFASLHDHNVGGIPHSGQSAIKVA